MDVLNKRTNAGIIFASIIADICFWLPAAILLIVKQVSFSIFFFVWLNNLLNLGKILNLISVCVCSSSPVTIFPTVINAACWTDDDWFLLK